MLVKFKQAVHLDGKDYGRGTHEVPEKSLKHPHFHKMIKAGWVEDGEAAKVVSPLSLAERQVKLAEKLAAGTKKPKSAVPADPEPSQGPQAGDDDAPEAASSPVEEDLVEVAEKLEAEAQVEAEADEEESAKKHKKKKR